MRNLTVCYQLLSAMKRSVRASFLSKILGRNYVGRVADRIRFRSGSMHFIVQFREHNSRFRNGSVCDLFGRFSGFLRESGEFSSRSTVTISQVRHLKTRSFYFTQSFGLGTVRIFIMQDWEYASESRPRSDHVSRRLSSQVGRNFSKGWNGDIVRYRFSVVYSQLQSPSLFHMPIQ